ncbi:MAG TPA: IPT/TIG domain-containing protein, partial [Vicinamibacteria bacterium]
IAGGVGTSAPALVTEGGAESNPAPFYVGRIPLLLKVEPASVVPGDLVVLSGRGFRRAAHENTLRIGGVTALVISASDSEVRLVAPFAAIGAAGGLELRVAGSDNAAQGELSVMPSSDVVDFRFAAQPFDAVPGRDHAVLATGLGPAFVLAAAGGKSAAERAYDVQQRLNQAGTLLKASRDVDIELRNADTAPALALVGKTETLMEVTEEDAAAYNEDWTGLKGRGGAVTRTRLARWWEAVAKDLVLMLVRGAKPANAPALAPEGRILNDLSLAAQKTGRFGVPWSVVEALRPPQRDAVRMAALRVPATVTGPGGAASGPQTAALKIDGLWVGFEREGSQRRDVSASFGDGTGSIAIEAAVTLTLPLLTLETRKNEAHWSLQFRGGTRYYSGKWDGSLLTGTISTDPAGREPVGTFELKPR